VLGSLFPLIRHPPAAMQTRHIRDYLSLLTAEIPLRTSGSTPTMARPRIGKPICRLNADPQSMECSRPSQRLSPRFGMIEQRFRGAGGLLGREIAAATLIGFVGLSPQTRRWIPVRESAGLLRRAGHGYAPSAREASIRSRPRINDDVSFTSVAMRSRRS